MRPARRHRRRLAGLGYLATTGEASEAVTESLRSDGLAPQDRVGDINLVSRLRQGLARGAFGVAKQTTLQLVNLAPDNPFYRAKLAASYLGLGQTGEAAKVVEATATISAALRSLRKECQEKDTRTRATELMEAMEPR